MIELLFIIKCLLSETITMRFHQTRKPYVGTYIK